MTQKQQKVFWSIFQLVNYYFIDINILLSKVSVYNSPKNFYQKIKGIKMILKRNFLAALISIITITGCGGGSSSSNKVVDVKDDSVSPADETSQDNNTINESNAINLFRQHLSAVIDSPIPVYDIAQIAINGDFSNEQDASCKLSGSMTKEIVFQRQPNSFLTYEDNEIQYSFQECSNKASQSINGKLNLRYDLYLNDSDNTYSSIDSNNYKIALSFDSIEDNSTFNNLVNGDVEYNRYKEPGIDETNVYSDFTNDNGLWGYKELKKVTYKFTIIENLAQRHESISGKVYLDSFQKTATFITNEVLVRDVERRGFYSEGLIKLIYGDTSAELELFSDDSATIDIYSEPENTLIYSLINIPQRDIFTRF